MWKKLQKVLLNKKFTVFPEIQKVGPFWQNFIREYPYEPQKTSKNVTFSYHYFGWFQVSESCKTLCLASILVRYKVPTQFWNLPPINTIFMGWGQICPNRVKGKVDKKKQKKLTNVSLVCMYVGRKSEMSVFFCFFPKRSNLSTISMVGKKTEKCQFFM